MTKLFSTCLSYLSYLHFRFDFNYVDKNISSRLYVTLKVYCSVSWYKKRICYKVFSTSQLILLVIEQRLRNLCILLSDGSLMLNLDKLIQYVAASIRLRYGVSDVCGYVSFTLSAGAGLMLSYVSDTSWSRTNAVTHRAG